MSVATQDAPAPQALAPEDSCAHCGAAMADDQEWCLECGAARTLIHRAPDWRIPLAIIGTVLMVALAGFAIALVGLSSDANRVTQATVTKSVTAAAPVAQTATTQASQTNKTFPGWPVGVSGWTVAFAQRHVKARADAIARWLSAGGIQVGILDSSKHPSMQPGYWVVFSGRYPDQAAAAAAAARLRARGHRRAQARRVAPPGGI